MGVGGLAQKKGRKGGESDRTKVEKNKSEIHEGLCIIYR